MSKGGNNRDWGYASYDETSMTIIVTKTCNIQVMKKMDQ